MVRIRLSDKLARVKALTRGDSQQVQDESPGTRCWILRTMPFWQ